MWKFVRLIVLVTVSVSLFADDFTARTNTFGTSAESILVVGEEAFSASASSVTWATGANAPLRFITGGTGYLTAPVMLPEGASVTGIEVEGCDNSATGSLDVVLYRCPPISLCTPITAVTTGGPPTPGCTIPRTTIANTTISNTANTYALQYDNAGDTSGNAAFRAVRVYYKLQVSADPATATFADVPVGHPQHRFVEALAAAGITGGCGSGNYCPDAPLTRGQMAVFLAVALGLHWAP